MKNIITGIMVLLFVLAVTFVPLSAKAEMQVMADNEMQMVTGQINGGNIIAWLITDISGVLQKNMSASDFTKLNNTMTKFGNALLSTKLMVAIMPTFAKIMSVEIPFTPVIQ